MRRSRRRHMFSVSSMDLYLGPGFLDPDRPEEEQAAHIEAVREWYAAHGGPWELGQIERRPGRRSWAWWDSAGLERPWDREVELRYLAANDELGHREVEAIHEAAARIGNGVTPNGVAHYGDGNGPSVHGHHPVLVAARVVREVLGPPSEEGP